MVTVLIVNISVMKDVLQTLFNFKHHSASGAHACAAAGRERRRRGSPEERRRRRDIARSSFRPQERGGVFTGSRKRCISFRRVG